LARAAAIANASTGTCSPSAASCATVTHASPITGSASLGGAATITRTATVTGSTTIPYSSTGEILSTLLRAPAKSVPRLGSFVRRPSVELLRRSLISIGDPFPVFSVVLPIALTARR
jgi:hypothetical protein